MSCLQLKLNCIMFFMGWGQCTEKKSVLPLEHMPNLNCKFELAYSMHRIQQVYGCPYRYFRLDEMNYIQIVKKGRLVISWIFNQMEIFTSVKIMLPNRSVLLYAVFMIPVRCWARKKVILCSTPRRVKSLLTTSTNIIDFLWHSRQLIYSCWSLNESLP